MIRFFSREGSFKTIKEVDAREAWAERQAWLAEKRAMLTERMSVFLLEQAKRNALEAGKEGTMVYFTPEAEAMGKELEAGVTKTYDELVRVFIPELRALKAQM